MLNVPFIREELLVSCSRSFPKPCGIDSTILPPFIPAPLLGQGRRVLTMDRLHPYLEASMLTDSAGA